MERHLIHRAVDRWQATQSHVHYRKILCSLRGYCYFKSTDTKCNRVLFDCISVLVMSVIDCRFLVEMYMCYYTYSGCGDRGKGAGQPLTEKSRTFSTYRARCPSLNSSIIHPFSLPPTVTLTFTSYSFLRSQTGWVSKHVCVCVCVCVSGAYTVKVTWKTITNIINTLQCVVYYLLLYKKEMLNQTHALNIMTMAIMNHLWLRNAYITVTIHCENMESYEFCITGT